MSPRRDRQKRASAPGVLVADNDSRKSWAFCAELQTATPSCRGFTTMAERASAFSSSNACSFTTIASSECSSFQSFSDKAERLAASGGTVPLGGAPATAPRVFCRICPADATLLCMLRILKSESRAAPHLPQNCSSAIDWVPHFQHGDFTAVASPAKVSVLSAEADRSSTEGGGPDLLSPGFNLSIVASILDRSAAIEFFAVNSASRPIDSVTSPAISWQVWISCSAKP